MNTISSKIVSKSGTQEGNILARAARERIIVASMRGVGAQLLNMFHMEEDDPAPHEWAEIPEEPCIEMAEDESRELEDRAMDAVDNSGTPPAGCPDKIDALWSIYRFGREISAPHASTFLDSLAGLPKSHLLDLLGDPVGLKASLDTFIFNNPAPRQYETSYPSESGFSSSAAPSPDSERDTSMAMDAEEVALEVRRPARALTLPGGNVRQLTVSPPRPSVNMSP